jgi:hypothetical protein
LASSCRLYLRSCPALTRPCPGRRRPAARGRCPARCSGPPPPAASRPCRTAGSGAESQHASDPTTPEFRTRLEWRSEGIERWGLGSPVLSVGLPIGTPTGPCDMRGLDFFENTLPEGRAIMVIPGGERPGGNGGSGYSPMAPGDLRRVISALDVAPWAPHRSAASARPWPASSVRRCSAAPPTGPGNSPTGTLPRRGYSSPTACTRWLPTRPRA